METIYKVGDKVFHIDFGWGIIDYINDCKDDLFPIQVIFNEESYYFMLDGRFYDYTGNKTLSFTEYTLQGFSQERLIELPEVGDLCLVRDMDGEKWCVKEFYKYYPNDKYPYEVGDSKTRYKQMKRIKILD